MAEIPFRELADQTHIHGLAVDPFNTTQLLVSTHNGIFAVSRLGSAERISRTSDDFMSLTPHPTNRTILFASGHPSDGGNLGLIRSVDGGRTWEQVSKGAVGQADFHSLAVSGADPRIMYGIYGGFQVSRDGGRTWHLGGQLLDRIMDIAASSLDPNTLYGATYDGLLLSVDGGNSWHSAGLPTRPVSLVRAINGVVYAFFAGAGLMRAKEAVPQWELISKSDQVFNLMAFDPENTELLYAITNDKQLLESRNGGQTWTPFQSDE